MDPAADHAHPLTSGFLRHGGCAGARSAGIVDGRKGSVMAFGRERRQERRAERHGAPAPVQYRLRQRLLSIGDDFWIETNHGERVYKVDGKALRLRQTFRLEDAAGRELVKIQERKLRIKDSMEIENADGTRVALVKKALISPLRHRFAVEVADGGDLEVHGNVVDHEYTFERDGATVASVSKRWFRVADTYGVEVIPGQDPVLVLAVTVAIDSMCHEDR